MASAILGRTREAAHRSEVMCGGLELSLKVGDGVVCGPGAALEQAAGSLVARPLLQGGVDRHFALLIRVATSGLTAGVLATLSAASLVTVLPLLYAAHRAPGKRHKLGKGGVRGALTVLRLALIFAQ